MQDIDDTADSVLTRNATRPIDTYLDLGCSPGGFSSWVMDQYPDAMGLGVTLPPDIGGLPMVSFPEGDYEVNYADLTDLRQTTEAIEKRFGSDADGVVDLALAAAIYR
jgi:trans-aconitate methyltransferase